MTEYAEPSSWEINLSNLNQNSQNETDGNVKTELVNLEDKRGVPENKKR